MTQSRSLVHSRVRVDAFDLLAEASDGGSAKTSDHARTLGDTTAAPRTI